MRRPGADRLRAAPRVLELFAAAGHRAGTRDQRSLEGDAASDALTGSSYTTGQSVTWVQKRDGCAIGTWERPQRKSVDCQLGVDHVMASSALPFLFPAVKVDGAWFGDGGIRLTAPLSPAVHLGARRILAVSTRYARSRDEADRPSIAGIAAALVSGVLIRHLSRQLFPSAEIHRITAIAGCGIRARGSATDHSAVAAAVGRPCRLPTVRAQLPRAFRLPPARHGNPGDAVERHVESVCPGDYVRRVRSRCRRRLASLPEIALSRGVIRRGVIGHL